MSNRASAAAAMLVGGVFGAAGVVQAMDGNVGAAFWALLLAGISIGAGVGIARTGGHR